MVIYNSLRNLVLLNGIIKDQDLQGKQMLLEIQDGLVM